MNRVQSIRSSITGNRPTPGTRAPGELYANFADNALGVIDVSQNPVDLIAVRYWSVAANYSAGSHVIYNGALYYALVAVTAGAFNPAQWSSVGSSYVLPIASTTVLGGVKIDGTSITIDGSGVISSSGGGGGGGSFLPLSGGTLTGDLTVAEPSGNSTILIKKVGSTQLAQLEGWSGSNVRWDLTLGDQTPETGGNVGSDFSLNAFADGAVDGSTPLFVPIFVKRSTGLVYFPAGDPVDPNGAATKHYVDAHSVGANPNLLDNGDMSVQQRPGASLAVTSGGHILLDRWAAYATASRYTIGQTYNGLPPPPGFATFLGAQCTSATAPASTDYFALQQGIEGATLNGLKWGAAGAQPVALSFWACSSVTGTFSGALNNGANNRTYAFTFSLPVASTPTFISMTIHGDTAGTWVNIGPSAQMFLIFDLGSGASNRTTAGSWGAGDFVGATGAAGIMGNNGATFYVTGVKLELGSATPYVYDPPQVRLARCQRYYLSLDQAVAAVSGKAPGDLSYTIIPFMVNMRAVPSWTFGTITYVNGVSLAVDTATTTSAVLRVANTSGSTGKATSIPMSFAAEI